MVKPSDRQKKFIILATLTAIIALLHYATSTEMPFPHETHILLRKLYFLPPVMAAAWFGLRGACLTALGVSLVFILHDYMNWPADYLEQANRVGELAGFWVAGVVPGWLFDRQRSLLQKIANANEETLVGLVSALDLREHNTCLHSQRVREYTELIARRFGVDEEARREIGLGALLHDVGKIAIPDQILLNTGKLTEEQWSEMHKHPEIGYRMVKRIGFLKNAAEIVYAHHERYDGKGYPRGLKGEEIPLGARLFKVADVYDALTSLRLYRSPLSYEEAAAKIMNQKNRQFDPAVVKVFMALAPEELQSIAKRYPDGYAGPGDAL
jgi:putative nucleotidyltransferase with HDIG domain